MIGVVWHVVECDWHVVGVESVTGVFGVTGVWYGVWLISGYDWHVVGCDCIVIGMWRGVTGIPAMKQHQSGKCSNCGVTVVKTGAIAREVLLVAELVHVHCHHFPPHTLTFS